jgi:hypothetical protein
MTLNYMKDDRFTREVYCYQCRVYSYSAEPVPKCPTCDSNLITVVYSKISGHKVTGAGDDISPK